MKILLMVQNGDARPKCIGTPPGLDYSRVAAARAQIGFTTNDAQGAAVKAATRWWLVEADSADAARETIASGRAELRSGFGGDGSLLVGRILASGGNP